MILYIVVRNRLWINCVCWADTILVTQQLGLCTYQWNSKWYKMKSMTTAARIINSILVDANFWIIGEESYLFWWEFHSCDLIWGCWRYAFITLPIWNNCRHNRMKYVHTRIHRLCSQTIVKKDRINKVRLRWCRRWINYEEYNAHISTWS